MNIYIAMSYISVTFYQMRADAVLAGEKDETLLGELEYIRSTFQTGYANADSINRQKIGHYYPWYTYLYNKVKTAQ